MNNISIISIIISIIFIYPSSRYYIIISSYNDYDFSNMFIQSMILKIFFTGVMLIGYGVLYGVDDWWVTKGSIGVVGVRLVIIVVYLGFMIFNRFATRFSNFKFFCALIAIGWIGKIFVENIINKFS